MEHCLPFDKGICGGWMGLRAFQLVDCPERAVLVVLARLNLFLDLADMLMEKITGQNMTASATCNLKRLERSIDWAENHT